MNSRVGGDSHFIVAEIDPAIKRRNFGEREIPKHRSFLIKVDDDGVVDMMAQLVAVHMIR